MTSDPRPRIAIPIPTLTQADYNARSWPQYAAAVERAGGEAVEVPLTLTPGEIARLATGCQGILLPGSPADINPAKYGQDRHAETAQADPARENVDELLLQDAHNLHKPLLTVCYGTQSLNTWRTGTLVQHLWPVPVNHRAGKSVAVAHSVIVEPGSRLGAILEESAEKIAGDGALRLDVNSSHHQAVGLAGDGLRVVARCPRDSVVEAIEGQNPDHFVLGLQWHPERNSESTPSSQSIFRNFVQACAAWQPRPATGPL